MSYQCVNPVTPQQWVDGMNAAIEMGQFCPFVAESVLKQKNDNPKTRDLKPCGLHPELWTKQKKFRK